MDHLRGLQDHIEGLQQRNDILETEARRNNELTQTVEAQRRRIDRLKRAVRAFYDSDKESVDNDEEMGSDSGEGIAEGDAISEDGDRDGDGGAPDPVYDVGHDIYRCEACWSELEPNYFCRPCGIAHQVPEDAPEIWNQSDDVEAERWSGERSTKPRGTTPLLDCDIDVAVPDEFPGTRAEYTALLRRGATHLMISRFQLLFSIQRGIIGYADETIFHDWSGPGMKEGDVWSFELGRRIRLDQCDEDGSDWICEFLENAITFPEIVYPDSDVEVSLAEDMECEDWECETAPDVLMFETVSLGPGLWVTRPADPEVTNEDASNLPADVLRTDAYEVDPISEDEFVDDVQSSDNYDTMSDTESEAEPEELNRNGDHIQSDDDTDSSSGGSDWDLNDIYSDGSHSD